MSTAEEATVNPDGSTTFNDAGGADSSAGEDMPGAEETAEEIIKGTDPALYLALASLVFFVIFIFVQLRKKKKNAEVDEFFANLDGDKFNLQLPAAVDEYYEVKEKCEDAGWEPNTPPEDPTKASPHHRALAQALMKRCMADIPIVTHIQSESAGMNKLYSQSMCSVKQWKSYQAAEAMVSAEVEEVRAEADEIEAGWSQVVWRQAMQYHNMLKQKEEQAKNAAKEQQLAIAAKKRSEDDKKTAEKNRFNAVKQKVEDEKAKIVNAEKTALELVKEEERAKASKKAFSGKGGMKKGFLG